MAWNNRLKSGLHRAYEALGNMPISRAIGSVITDPTPQGVGQSISNLGSDISANLERSFGSGTTPEEMAMNFSPVGGTIIGKGAKGWEQAEGKFSSMFDKMERAEISDYGSKFGLEHNKDISDYIISQTKKPDGRMLDLSEILSHPKLYEQYPELAQKRVLIKDLASGTLGYYDDGLLVIDGKLFRDNPELARTTLLHELQHLIQQEENFAKGSSQGSFVPSMAKDIDMYASAKDIKDISVERGISTDEAVKYIKDLGLESPSQESYMIASTRDKDYIDKMLKQYEDNWAGKSFELYQNTAGEIEARSVARRSNIPQEQLKYSQPYAGENIPFKEWIRAEDFLEDGPRVMAMTAYHGTPHKIVGGFKKEAIGSGEGAQAFGHGFYATDAKGIAKGYAEKLIQQKKVFRSLSDEFEAIKIEGLPLHKIYDINPSREFVDAANRGDTTTILDIAKREKGHWEELSKDQTYGHRDYAATKSRHWAALEETLNSGKRIEPSTGRVYTLDIPEPDVMLDWDKPLREQPEGVSNAVRGGKFNIVSPPYTSRIGGMSGREIIEYSPQYSSSIQIKDVGSGQWHVDIGGEPTKIFSSKKDSMEYVNRWYFDKKTTGEGIYDRLVEELGTPEKASEYLDSVGVKGIRYKAGRFLGVKTDASNYVVFEPGNIKITAEEFLDR